MFEFNLCLLHIAVLPSAHNPNLQKRYLSSKLVAAEHLLMKDMYDKKDVVPMLYEMANVIGTSNLLYHFYKCVFRIHNYDTSQNI